MLSLDCIRNLGNHACMTQVTVRRVDDAWVAKAKREAAKLGVSMNQVLVEALGRGLGMQGERARTTNLDRYAGDSDFGAGWDEFLENDLKRIDEELYFLREKGTPIPTNDIWIAAMVRETGGKLLTRDSHFECLPQVELERERQ